MSLRLTTEGKWKERKLPRPCKRTEKTMEYEKMVYAQPSSFLQNDTHKLPWDFNIQTDQLIMARRPDLIIINKQKRICKIVISAVSADHRTKLKECEKKDKNFDFALELKKTMEHEGSNCTNRDWCFWYSNKRIIKGTGGLGGWRTSGDHSNYGTIENDQNTETSPEDLWSLSFQWKTIN